MGALDIHHYINGKTPKLVHYIGNIVFFLGSLRIAEYTQFTLQFVKNREYHSGHRGQFSNQLTTKK